MSNQATLKNLFAGRVKMSTVINKVEKLLREQGKPAYLKDKDDPTTGVCQYFGSDGTGCAVGVILPKGLKDTIIANGHNSTGIYNILDNYGHEIGYIENSSKAIMLLRKMQGIHDEYMSNGHNEHTPWDDYIKERFNLLRHRCKDIIKTVDKELMNHG